MGWCAARSSRWASDWPVRGRDRKSTRLNSIHGYISYAVFCLKKKKIPDVDAAHLPVREPVVVAALHPDVDDHVVGLLAIVAEGDRVRLTAVVIRRLSPFLVAA